MDIDSTNFNMTTRRGDSELIRIHPTSTLFEEGDAIILTVRKGLDSPIILQKKVTEFIDGDALISIDSNDTSNLAIDTYLYDIEYKSSDGRIVTLIPNNASMSLPKFKITGDVTRE